MNTTSEQQPVFQTRHFHIYNWNNRVVFACVSATRIEAGKMHGGIREVRSERDKCALRRKLEA
jgi:hypothetical protein